MLGPPFAAYSTPTYRLRKVCGPEEGRAAFFAWEATAARGGVNDDDDSEQETRSGRPAKSQIEPASSERAPASPRRLPGLPS